MNTMSLVLVLTLCGISLGYTDKCARLSRNRCRLTRWCFWAPNGICAPIVQCESVVVGVPPVRTNCDRFSSCKWDAILDECVDPCAYYNNPSDCNNSPYGSQCSWSFGFCESEYVIDPSHGDTKYCMSRGTYNSLTLECDCQGESYLNQCQGCGRQYDALQTCSKCVTQKYNSGNTCRLCDVNLDCSNHANSVSSGTAASPGCNCNCSAGFTGNTCNSCDTGYFGTNCAACDNAYCNNHVKLGNVPQVRNGSITTCDCNCADEYSGPRCNTCANNHIDYPNCVRCDLGIHCNGNAGSVISTASNSKCSCSCTSGYTGDACDICDTNYVRDPSLPGIKCRQCSIATDCNGLATTVSSDAILQRCVCQCSSLYTGSSCELCASGRVNHPACSLCDKVMSCNSRATSVIQQGNSCVCSCRNKWDPADNCLSCNPPYAGTDCDTCMPGHINYPNCTLCTLNDCNNRASSVTSNANKDGCSCNCTGQWVGNICDDCPVIFEQTMCSSCAAVSASPYPVCTGCTIDSHCGGSQRASSVTMSNMQTCDCTCIFPWTGQRCQVCPIPFSGTSCDSCTDGYIQVVASPLTCELCDILKHCTPSQTASVHSNRSTDKCMCSCVGNWNGESCDNCPIPLGGSQCECSVESHCGGTNRAIESNTVTVNNVSSCSCVCSGNWQGTNCSECPHPYSGSNCSTLSCTLSDCSGPLHAFTVVADPAIGQCRCNCSGFWTGAECEICPPAYGGSKCDELHCTKAGNCTSDGSAVSVHHDLLNNYCICNCTDSFAGEFCEADCGGPCVNGYRKYWKESTTDSCACDCFNSWEGRYCETCPLQFTGANCSECARGRVNYPTCDICDISICEQHRNPLTMRIRQNVSDPECQCVYKDDVTACAAPFYTSSCEACSLPIHCTGDAYAVEVDEDDPNSCLCQCRNASQSCQRGESTASPVSINPINVFESKGSVPVGIVASGSIGGTSAARLKAIGALCGKEDDVLDPEINPLKLKVGNSKYAAYIGGVLGNCVFVLSPIIVHLTAVLIRTRYPNRVEFKEAAADLRFPYISLFFVIFMFHGMATCGLKLLIFGGAGEKVLGVSVLLSFNIGFLVLIVAKTRSLSKDVTYFDRAGTTLVSRYFFGNGEWVSATQKRQVHRWGLLFEMYRPGFTWFLICECIVLLTITVVQVSEASRMLSCRNLAGLLVALFGGLTLVIMYFGPWASRFDNHGNGLILGLETVACGFLVRGFSTEDRSDMGFTYASNILIVVSYLTVAKGFIDPFLLLYVEWTRRSTIQDNYNTVCQTQEKCQQLGVEDELFEDDDFAQYPLSEFEMTAKGCVDFNDPICNEGGKSTPLLTNIRSAPTPELALQRIASPLSARNSAARSLNSSTRATPLRLASYPLIEKQRNNCLVDLSL